MMQILAVQFAQGFSAIAWSVALAYYAPFAWRLLRGRGDVLDLAGALLAVHAGTQIEFVARWYVYAHHLSAMTAVELSWWMSLYVRSGLVALAFVAVTSTYVRIKRP